MKKLITLYIAIFLVSNAVMSQESEQESSNFQLSNVLNISYSMGFPAGDFYDFISQPSFRGISVDIRSFVSDNLSIGVAYSWNGFYEKYDRRIYEFGSGAVTGTKFNYLYHTSLFLNTHYYPVLDFAVVPYAGLNLGLVYSNKIEEMGVISIYEDKWAFALAPEVGLILPLGRDVGLITFGRYNRSFYSEDNMLKVGYIQWGIGLSMLR